MEDDMKCSDHPYRNNPGGLCAICLQQKLGKLVSSSFPLPIRGSSSSSSSSSPSFRSDTGVVPASCGYGGTSSLSLSLSLSVRPTSNKSKNDNGNNNNSHYQEYYTRRARIPFLLAKKNKKKKIMVASSDHHHAAAADIVFKRSKSTTTPRRSHRFLDDSVDDIGEDFSPRKKGGFWSFLYLSSKSHSTKKLDKIAGATPSAATSFEGKVSRSRSVGCGSRSFSGDFFERISTGLGDCNTLRRVESQREEKEGKPKVAAAAKCGGIFGGFIMMNSSSSSSSSSSSYWVSSSAEDHVHVHVNGKSKAGPLVDGRSKSWSWSWANFASPMRAFSKTSSGKRDTIIRESNNKNKTPNLAAIPSLLAVRV